MTQKYHQEEISGLIDATKAAPLARTALSLKERESKTAQKTADRMSDLPCCYSERLVNLEIRFRATSTMVDRGTKWVDQLEKCQNLRRSVHCYH